MGLRAFVTPLHQAVINRSLSEMMSLLDNGTSADIHESQLVHEVFDIESSLKRFSALGCLKLIRAKNAPFDIILNQVIREPVVIECEAEALQLKAGMTPIFLTVMLNFQPGFELLLDRGADVNVKDRDGNTPLHYAARNGNFVKMLLDRGADVDIMNITNQTPIYFAIESKCRIALSLLIEKSACINTKDVTGSTPLHVAVRKGFNFGTKLLLDKGIDVNQTDLGKQTPLFSAVQRGSVHIFRLLVEKGASVDIIDNLYKTPAKYNPKVVHWLEELERLKTLKIGHWSLYDLFSLSNHGDPLIVTNVEMASAVSSPILETEFPYYAPSLKKCFFLAEERYKIITEAHQYLPSLFPKEIRRLILSYVSNKDLSNFIRANIAEINDSQCQNVQ